MLIWKAFRQDIADPDMCKSGLSKFCGRQPLKNVLSPLLNILSRINLKFSLKKDSFLTQRERNAHHY